MFILISELTYFLWAKILGSVLGVSVFFRLTCPANFQHLKLIYCYELLNFSREMIVQVGLYGDCDPRRLWIKGLSKMRNVTDLT